MRLLFAALLAATAPAIEGLVGAGISVETRDARGFTALILATYHGHAEAVRTLLRLGADACSGDGRHRSGRIARAPRRVRPILGGLGTNAGSFGCRAAVIALADFALTPLKPSRGIR
jgi:ankyrin repeat protein